MAESTRVTLSADHLRLLVNGRVVRPKRGITVALDDIGLDYIEDIVRDARRRKDNNIPLPKRGNRK